MARTLSERGYFVICGLDGYDRGAEVSRYVSAVWEHPNEKEYPEKFQEALESLCKRHKDLDLIIPVSESFVKLFAENKLTKPQKTKLVSQTPEIIKLCLDKAELLEKTRKLNIPVAPFAITQNIDEILEKAPQIGFPLVVRPLQSTVRLAGKKAVTCHSLEDLKSGYEEWKTENSSLLIQRRVSGVRHNMYFAAQSGKILRYLEAKIQRTDQPDGSGLALEGKTIPTNEIRHAYVTTLIKELNYTGIGCAQFLVDDEKKQNYFLEINPRIAGNHALPEAFGLDLGNYLIDLETAEKQISINQEHIRYTWLAGECESLRLQWRKGDLSSLSFVKNLLKAFYRWWKADMDIAINTNDWKPGILSLCDSLPAIGSITRQRFKPGLIQKLLIRKEWL